jgi:hypothetical protein
MCVTKRQEERLADSESKVYFGQARFLNHARKGESREVTLSVRVEHKRSGADDMIAVDCGPRSTICFRQEGGYYRGEIVTQRRRPGLIINIAVLKTGGTIQANFTVTPPETDTPAVLAIGTITAQAA